MNEEAVPTPAQPWRYGRTAMALHWTIAALVAVLLGLGWYMLSVEEDPGSARLFALHISLGLAAALLIVVRLAWRVGNPPQPAAVRSVWQARAARATHGLLYTMLVLMPSAGFLGASFSSDAVGFFGLALPRWAQPDDALREKFFAVHSFVAWILLALISLHVLGALKHLFVDRDGVFWRMWPGGRRRLGR